jgi:hypothetical protein
MVQGVGLDPVRSSGLKALTLYEMFPAWATLTRLSSWFDFITSTMTLSSWAHIWRVRVGGRRCVDLAQSRAQRADASLFLEGKHSAQFQHTPVSAPRRAKRRTSVGPAAALPPVRAPRNPSCLSQTAHTARHPHSTRLAPTQFARGHPALQLTLAFEASAGTLPSFSDHRNLALRLTRRCWRWDTNTLQMFSACRARAATRCGPGTGTTLWFGALDRSTDPGQKREERSASISARLPKRCVSSLRLGELDENS